MTQRTPQYWDPEAPRPMPLAAFIGSCIVGALMWGLIVWLFVVFA